jgi:hypothetical protein
MFTFIRFRSRLVSVALGAAALNCLACCAASLAENEITITRQTDSTSPKLMRPVLTAPGSLHDNPSSLQGSNQPAPGAGQGTRPPNGIFELDDFSFDIEQTLNIGSSTSGSGAGKVKFNSFNVTKQTNSTSPKLMQHVIYAQQGNLHLPPGIINGFNPQPDPPGDKADAGTQGLKILNVEAAHGFNPQPDPPGDKADAGTQGLKILNVEAAHGFNPQPDPPGDKIGCGGPEERKAGELPGGNQQGKFAVEDIQFDNGDVQVNTHSAGGGGGAGKIDISPVHVTESGKTLPANLGNLGNLEGLGKGAPVLQMVGPTGVNPLAGPAGAHATLFNSSNILVPAVQGQSSGPSGPGAGNTFQGSKEPGGGIHQGVHGGGFAPGTK